jgi:hypothetical protein
MEFSEVRKFMLEDISSIREGLWRMSRYAQHVAEALDSPIGDEDLDGLAETVEVAKLWNAFSHSALG